MNKVISLLKFFLYSIQDFIEYIFVKKKQSFKSFLFKKYSVKYPYNKRKNIFLLFLIVSFKNEQDFDKIYTILRENTNFCSKMACNNTSYMNLFAELAISANNQSICDSLFRPCHSKISEDLNKLYNWRFGDNSFCDLNNPAKILVYLNMVINGLRNEYKGNYTDAQKFYDQAIRFFPFYSDNFDRNVINKRLAEVTRLSQI